jgi:hypothetical protein
MSQLAQEYRCRQSRKRNIPRVPRTGKNDRHDQFAVQEHGSVLTVENARHREVAFSLVVISASQDVSRGDSRRLTLRGNDWWAHMHVSLIWDSSNAALFRRELVLA